MSQFLGESVATALFALCIAVVAAKLILPTFNAFFNKQMGLGLLSEPLLGPALLSIAILVGMAAGTYPAVFLSSFQPTETLKGTFRAGPRGQLVRKILVIVQFVISIALIIGTGVIYQQMDYMRTKKLGYNTDQIVVVPLFWTDQEAKSSSEFRLADRYQAIKHAFLSHSNVLEATAYRWGLGWGGGIIRTIRAEGHEDTDWRMPVLEVDDDYIDVFRIRLTEGRKFDLDTFPSDTSGAYIINQSAVEKFGWEDPIGKSFEWVDRHRKGTVIGVVEDFHYSPLREKIGPASLTIHTKQYYNLALRIKPDGIEETVAHFKQLWGQFVDENISFDHLFWDQQFVQMYARERRVHTLTMVSSGIAILLACMGLFGLASFAMEERRKEIGVRKSLGATVSSVVVLVSREFLMMVAISALIAAPVAWRVMNGWLSNFAYRMELGAGVFVVGALIALVIAQATVTYHAVRAARMDPVKALRYE